MTTLAKTQSQFWQAVRANSGQPPLFNDSPGLGITARTRVYREAYWLRQLQAMATVLPQTYALLGSSVFDECAKTYLEAFPSTECELEWVCARFSVWARAKCGQLAGDLADFEWAGFCALVAPDQPSVSLAEAKTGLQPDTTVTLAQHVHLLRVGGELLRHLHFDFDGTERVPAVLYRKDFQVKLHLVGEGERAAVLAAKTSASLSDVCALLTHDCESEPAAIFNQLHRWLASGWVTELMNEEKNPCL